MALGRIKSFVYNTGFSTLHALLGAIKRSETRINLTNFWCCLKPCRNLKPRNTGNGKTVIKRKVFHFHTLWVCCMMHDCNLGVVVQLGASWRLQCVNPARKHFVISQEAFEILPPVTYLRCVRKRIDILERIFNFVRSLLDT